MFTHTKNVYHLLRLTLCVIVEIVYIICVMKYFYWIGIVSLFVLGVLVLTISFIFWLNMQSWQE